MNTEKIISETIKVFINHSEDDRDQNMEIIAAMMGALFALLQTCANKNDCVKIVQRSMKEIGWEQ